MVRRGGVLANVSPAPEPVPQPAGTHENRTAAGATADCAGTRHNTQADRMSSQKNLFAMTLAPTTWNPLLLLP